MNKDEQFERIMEKIKYADLAKLKMLIGFDGFVDEVVYVVDTRTNETEYKRTKYLKDFGNKILRSAGLSMNVEMVTVQQKLGGNGPIFANALINMGCDVTYAGAIGKQELHPVYKEMAKKCHMIPLSEPAFTDAIEFLDGKIISSKLENFNDVNWENIVQEIGVDQLKNIIETCDVVGFENWTMIVHMTDIWEHILEDVLPYISADLKKKIFFVDLADPEKRNREDILKALHLLEQFAKYFRLILGLNKKEACEIAVLLGYEQENIADLPTAGLIQFIKSKLDIDTLVVHPVKEACAINELEMHCVVGPYCEYPKLTTGAGDNFNAGFILGQVIGCTLVESLLLGTANSGFYVRNAKSANLLELSQFLEQWKKDELNDI